MEVQRVLITAHDHDGPLLAPTTVLTSPSSMEGSVPEDRAILDATPARIDGGRSRRVRSAAVVTASMQTAVNEAQHAPGPISEADEDQIARGKRTTLRNVTVVVHTARARVRLAKRSTILRSARPCPWDQK